MEHVLAGVVAMEDSRLLPREYRAELLDASKQLSVPIGASLR